MKYIKKKLPFYELNLRDVKYTSENRTAKNYIEYI